MDVLSVDTIKIYNGDIILWTPCVIVMEVV